MTKAVKSQTRFAYIAEVTENVTPATPAFKLGRMDGESLDVNRAFSFSNELNGRRGEKNFAPSKQFGAGNTMAEFYDNEHEELLAAALRSVWSADAVQDANETKTFSLEVTNETGGTDIFKRFTGAQINTLALSIDSGEPIKFETGWLARGADFADAAIAGATYVAPGTDPTLTAADVSSISMAGLTIDCAPKITLSLNNNLDLLYCVGSISPTHAAAGKLEATGSIVLLLDSTQYATLRTFADGVPTSLQFSVGKGAGLRTRFTLPTVIIEDLKTVSESADGIVQLSFNYRALQASSLTGSVIRLERNV